MTFLPDPEGPKKIARKGQKSAKEVPNLAKLKTKNMDVLLKTKDDCLHR